MTCRPILYTYEADTHCTPCALERFGADDYGHVAPDTKDSEGNEPGVLARWDTWEDDEGYNVTTCGTCSLILCTSCGMTNSHEDRPVGAECWNCRTSWKEGAEDDETEDD